MNPRERFFKTVEHKQTDWVPIDLGGWLFGIRESGLIKLKDGIQVISLPIFLTSLF
ncbi:MAG: hypothetical protein KKH91_02935 [Elusimicrobia bacterium]|nr:hypothetical protein [Elusimicrobiota bacterium]MBU2615101.1 hypothetical protein [Elusimicrobiota bacterium]